MVALVDLVVVDEVGVGTLGPTAGCLVELVGGDGDGGRESGALDVEKAEGVLPVEPPVGDPGVGQPGEGDVVQDLVPSEGADRVAVAGVGRSGLEPGLPRARRWRPIAG